MKRSKWDLLKLIQDHEGRMTWYPIDTFFPMGSIVEDDEANGMDIVKDFVGEGLVSVSENEGESDCYSITAKGRSELAIHQTQLTSN
jgi:DNA-binding PadR family transcriptional regulator